MSPSKLVKCSSARCAGRDFFPNQIQVVGTSDRAYGLCPDCYGAVMSRMADREFVGAMIRSTMPVEEVQRMRAEIVAGDGRP